jgi:hypothetical protein
LQRIPEWEELTQEERGIAVERLEVLALDATPNLEGLRKLLARDYDVNSTLEELKRFIQRLGQERKQQRMKEEREKYGPTGPTKFTRTVSVPATLTSADELEALIKQLHDIKSELELCAEVELSISIQH